MGSLPRVRHRWTRLVVVLLCAAVSAIALSGQQPPASSPPSTLPSTSPEQGFESLYRRGVQLNASMKTLMARFTETTETALLTRPLVASGTIAVERPSRVVLHYLKPEPRDVLIEGDQLTMVWPGRGLRDVTNIAAANRRIQKYFVGGSLSDLRSSFEIVDEGVNDRPKTYKVSMLPKRRQIREGLTRLELWLDPQALLLSAMRMTFPNGDTKLMEFEGTTLNVPLDPAVFVIAAPPSTTVSR